MSTSALPSSPPVDDRAVAAVLPGSPGDDYLLYASCGDTAALERALRGCADHATTQARRLLGNAADADDAVQEAFLQLARTAHRYDGRVPFTAWVGKLVHTACLRVRRSDRRRRRREASAMTPHQVSDPEPIEESTLEAVRSAIARLPVADQTAIDLHYFAGLSQAETATALGTSENALAQRLVRARERLRRMLSADGMTLSVAALTTVLLSQPAYAASPTVLNAGGSLAAAVASDATLPATTIHLTWAQKGSLFMATHPFAAFTCGTVLIILGCAPLALWASDATSAIDSTPVAADGMWNPASREVLRWLDPQAPLHAAIDISAWRRNVATTKPLSLLEDPQAAPAMGKLRAALLASNPADNTHALVTILSNALEHGDAAALSVAENERWVHALKGCRSGG